METPNAPYTFCFQNFLSIYMMYLYINTFYNNLGVFGVLMVIMKGPSKNCRLKSMHLCFPRKV